MQLTITYGNDDPEPDLHGVERSTVRSCRTTRGMPMPSLPWRAATSLRRLASPGAAREVFSSLYPGLKVMVSQVYELVATAGTVC